MSASDGVTNITSARGGLASVESLVQNAGAIMSYDSQMDGQSFGNDQQYGLSKGAPVLGQP